MALNLPFLKFLRRFSLPGGISKHLTSKNLILFLSIGVLTTLGATFGAWDTFSLEPGMFRRLAFLLCMTLGFVVGLVVVMGRFLAQLWGQRQGHQAGARLHARLATLFGISAALPTLAMVVFATFSFRGGLQSWFTEKHQRILTQSLAVADGYIAEQKKVVRADAELIAQALRSYGLTGPHNATMLQKPLEELLHGRSLDEGVILDQNLHVLVSSRLTFTLQFELFSPSLLKEADLYPVVLTGERGDRMRALVALHTEPATYLYVGRFVDPKILGHLEETHGAVAGYQALEHHQGKISLFFALIMGAVGLLVILCSVGFALIIADQMIQPITHLMTAAERVRAGDLSARVPVGIRSYELSLLSRTFNRMVRQLGWQQQTLMQTNQTLESRNSILQTVLAGVRSGVIGLDPRGHLQWPNQMASELLHLSLDEQIGRPLGEVIPEFKALFQTLQHHPTPHVQAEIKRMSRQGTSTFLVRMALHMRSDGILTGYVVTFDDMTHILEAQRQATWAEAAKRVAHEIKNPLTPIRLAAERLRKKWVSSSAHDNELLHRCTETIIRQVDTIKDLINTFSDFTRLPTSTLHEGFLEPLLQEAITLHQMAHPEMKITFSSSGTPHTVRLAPPMITQVLNNIFLNAIQSIQAHQQHNVDLGGHIHAFLNYQPQTVTLYIEDNGEGLPQKVQDRLTEPYVTTKITGTGLGLSIVKKIMDEHRGSFSLENLSSGGARAVLVWPYASPPPSAAALS